MAPILPTRKGIITVVHNLKQKACVTNDTPEERIQVETHVSIQVSRHCQIIMFFVKLQKEHAEKIILYAFDQLPLTIFDVPLEQIGTNMDKFSTQNESFDNERILLFTTISNVEHLKKIAYWIMDGTLKAVPTH